MAIEVGKVEKIDTRWIELIVPPSEGCFMCHSGMSCSFNGPESGYGHIKIPYQSGITVGDKVTFETQPSAQNISALIIFGLPIFLILAGYFIFTKFFDIPHSELWGIFSGIFLYGILLIGFNKWFSKLPIFLPKIIKVEKIETLEQK